MSSESLIHQPLCAMAEPFMFASAQEAWIASLSQLYKCGEVVHGVQDVSSVGSAFGEKTRDTRELAVTAFSIASPRKRLINSAHRPIDLGYAIANVIWVLTGSDDVEMISFYNPRGRNFSDNGRTLFAAPGKRIFASTEGDQFERVVQRLKQDPTTRRAVISIFSPADLFADTHDCSCSVSLQFLLRNNAVSCIAHMRSQSALMVMPYDIFLFSMLHEAVAISVGAELGAYHHFCGSLHYYEDEEELTRSVINANEFSMPEMPKMLSASAEVRSRLGEVEQDIRRRLTENHAPINVCEYNLDAYWTGLLQAMIAAVRFKRRLPLSPDEFSLVPAVYRHILETHR